jgi:monoamine oxidase
MPEKSLDIGIAGAGISGLIAGLQLQKAGHRVIIFESRLRTGGRIQSITIGSYTVECGPEFIHGNLKETIELLNEYKIPYVPVNGKMYNVREAHFTEEYEMAPGWERMLAKMKSIQRDMPLQEFLFENFPGNTFQELRDAAVRFAEGFDLADTRTASVQALIREWEHDETEQYRIPSGYGTLVNAIVTDFTNCGGKILLDHAVKKVDWNAEKPEVILGNGTLCMVDKLIVSVPVGLLQKKSAESIEFSPPLSEKENAWNHIGFGSVVKIVMIWSHAFWEQKIPAALFIFSDNFFPTWWTQHPMDIPILTGWLGGPSADFFAGHPENFFLEKAMEGLSSIFSVPMEKLKGYLKEFKVFNWTNEAWSRGAYSYSRVGFQNHLEICRQPVQGKIFFAGEACYEGAYPGTVEAAVVTGLETARRLQDEIRDQ